MPGISLTQAVGEQVVEHRRVRFAQPPAGWCTAGLVDRFDDCFNDVQDVGAEALGLSIEAVFEAMGLAKEVRQTTQTLVQWH